MTSYLEHIVFIRVKKEATPEQTQKMIDALNALKGKIPELLDISAGRADASLSGNDRTDGFTHALRSKVLNKEDLKAYNDHPEHQKVLVECIRPIAEKVIAIDYVYTA
eukprot:Colp12_sorted_trinity150504_noHs@21818